MPTSTNPPHQHRGVVAGGGDGEIADLKRRLAESEKRQAEGEERLALITDATSDGIYEWNIETDDLTISPKLVDMFGLDPQVITPNLWAARIHPEDFAAYRAAMVSHFKGETERLRMVYRVPLEGGEVRWAAENGIAVCDDNGRAVRLISAISDISERREAEARLREREGLLRTVLDNCPQTIVMKDLEGRYVLVNEKGRDSFHRRYGFPDVIGLTALDVFGQANIEQIERQDAEVLAAREPITEEVTRYSTDKIPIHTLTNKFPIRDEEDNVIALGTIVTDITERRQAEEDLRLQTSLLHNVVESSGQGIVAYDENHRITVVNRHYVAMWPPAIQEILKVGTTLHDVVHATAELWFEGEIEVLAWAQERLRLLTSGEPTSGDISGLDGTVYHAASHPTPDGGLVVIYTDITERKQAEEALQESQEGLARMLDESPVGVSIIGADGKRIFVNSRHAEMLGQSKEKMTGTDSSSSFADPALRIQLRQRFERDGRIADAEAEYVRRDGSKIWVLLTMEPAEWAGEPVRMVWIYDITERKRVEGDLRQAMERASEAEATLTDALDNISEGFAIYDADERLVLCNEPYRTFYPTISDLLVPGCRYEEAVDAAIERNPGSRTPEDLERMRAQRLEMHRNPTGEASLFSTSQGGWVLTRARRTSRGGVVRVRTDVTERKKAEEEVRAAMEEADKANRAKSEFLANMSHEIRTPMNAIIGLSHLAMKTDLTGQQQDYLSKINSSSNALLGIINDILDFSKIEAGKLDIEYIDFNIDETLEGLSALIVSRAEEKGLEVFFSCAKEVPRNLIGDSLRLGQILTNLAGNAIKFTEQGEVVIAVKLRRNIATEVVLDFEVRDSGIGMTEQQMAKLFKSFSQADASTTRKYGGTGLGLTISKQLVELMGGEIGVRSTLGEGSTFFFSARFGVGVQAIVSQRLPDPDLRGMWVLVVDDNDVSRRILGEHLTNMSFNSRAVGSGEAALAELERVASMPDVEPYGLVLMDWKMPGLNGIETCNRIKADPRFANAPTIIMVTAFGRSEVKKQADEVGIKGFLLKPFNESVLFDTIMNAFGRSQIESATRIEPESSRDEALETIRGARILLAEDNEINQQVALEILEDKGFIVTIADDGRQAVAALTAAPDAFDLVLMDIQMPVLDGYGATAEIRQDPRFKDLPILAMTAHAMAGEKDKSKSKGLDDHITKPIDPDTLNDALVRWIKPKVVADTTAKTVVPDTTTKPEDDILPNDLPPFDIQAALARLNGKKKLLRKLLIKFSDTNVDLIPTLQGMLEREEYEEAERLAHTVKGGAGNLEAKNVFEASHRIEEALKEGRHEEVQDLIPALDAATKAAVEAVATLKR